MVPMGLKATNPASPPPAAVDADERHQGDVDGFVARHRDELNASIARSRGEIDAGAQSRRTVADIIADGRKRHGAG